MDAVLLANVDVHRPLLRVLTFESSQFIRDLHFFFNVLLIGLPGVGSFKTLRTEIFEPFRSFERTIERKK